MYGHVGLAVDRAALHLAGCDVMAGPRKHLGNHGIGKLILDALETQQKSEQAKSLNTRRSETLGWLLVLGILEPVFRGFCPISDVDVTGLGGKRLSPSRVAKWLASKVPSDLGVELSALIHSVSRCLPAGPYVLNPIFGGIGAIIGADGDLMADDTWVEIKCTVRGVQSSFIAQLICYYALDQLRPASGSRSFGVRSLALCLPRQHTTISGPVKDWLQAFGGPPAQCCAPLLKQFAGVGRPGKGDVKARTHLRRESARAVTPATPYRPPSCSVGPSRRMSWAPINP